MSITLLFQNIAGNKKPIPQFDWDISDPNLKLIYDFIRKQDKELTFTGKELAKRFNIKHDNLIDIALILSSMDLFEYEEIKEGDSGDIILFCTTV